MLQKGHPGHLLTRIGYSCTPLRPSVRYAGSPGEHEGQRQAGPKGRRLEFKARRAPRFLVHYNFLFRLWLLWHLKFVIVKCPGVFIFALLHNSEVVLHSYFQSCNSLQVLKAAIILCQSGVKDVLKKVHQTVVNNKCSWEDFLHLQALTF